MVHGFSWGICVLGSNLGLFYLGRPCSLTVIETRKRTAGGRERPCATLPPIGQSFHRDRNLRWEFWTLLFALCVLVLCVQRSIHTFTNTAHAGCDSV